MNLPKFEIKWSQDGLWYMKNQKDGIEYDHLVTFCKFHKENVKGFQVVLGKLKFVCGWLSEESK